MPNTGPAKVVKKSALPRATEKQVQEVEALLKKGADAQQVADVVVQSGIEIEIAMLKDRLYALQVAATGIADSLALVADSKQWPRKLRPGLLKVIEELHHHVALSKGVSTDG